MVSNQKTMFFSRKPKKTKKKKQKKTIFSKTMGLGPPKDGFFWFSREKDVVLVRNHLFLEKRMVFGGLPLVKPSFFWRKDGFSKDGCSKPSFSREKDVFEPKNHLFLEKTKKNQKHKKQNKKKKHLFQNYGAGASKRWFFFGFLEKKMVFLVRNHLFLEKKMVSNQKNHLFLEKTKKTIFWRPQPHSFGIDVFFFLFFCFLVFSGKRWFFGSKPSFSREKDGFEQPSFEKPSFSREKDGFTRRRPPKAIFFSRKGWFRTKTTSFSRENQKNHLLEAPAP